MILEVSAAIAWTGLVAHTPAEAGAPPELVKDILPGVESSFAEQFTLLNGQLYFRANNGANGFELWRSDGTSDGTQMVMDLNPGSPNSFPTNISAANGSLYFHAYDDTTFTGSKVFKSDGTAAGTTVMADTFAGMPGGFFGPPLPANFNALNPTTVVFTATDPVGGLELWRTNGTPAGTVRVKDIHPGQEWSIPSGLIPLNGIAYFTADDSFIDNGDGTRTYDRELWRTDGTEAGTFRLKDIHVGPQNSIPGDYTAFNGQMFFTAFEPGTGRELWKTDGTTDGTVVVDLVAGADDSSPEFLRPVGNKLFFVAQNAANGRELFVSDGTVGGTNLVKDIHPTGDSIPLELTPANDKLYFTADDGTHGVELWVTDGSEGGTHLVKDINPGEALSGPQFLTPAGEHLFFVTIVPNNVDFTVETQLWMTDGSELGTTMLWQSPGKDFGYSIRDLNLVGDRLLFIAPTKVDVDGFATNFELHSILVPEPSSCALAMLVVGMMAKRVRRW